MKVFTGKKGKKGFTMLEVVLTVAILLIAMAITVPGLVRISRNLRITKLDDTAREIYTSAQSRTVALSVSGQLPQSGQGEAKSVRARSRDASATAIQFVSKSDSNTDVTDALLPLGSIDEGVRQNYYIIEYNPVTAMICGVYYWENESNDFLENGYGKIDDSRAARMAYKSGMVGYYGGDDVGERPEAAGDSIVEAKLVNDEELYLTITQGCSGGVVVPGTITVTITDTDTGASKKIEFQNDQRVDISENFTYENYTVRSGEIIAPYFKLTLDSLKSGLRFSKLFPEGEGGSFHPGCNLKVTVSFQEDGKQAKNENFYTNSLYASVQGADNDRTAMIACGRHLENLGLLWVYPGKTANTSDTLNGVTKAVQTAEEIDWHKSLEAVGITNPDDFPSFKPIVNEKLEEFDGGGNRIVHANIFEAETEGETESPKSVLDGYMNPDAGVGLFSRFMGSKLTNVKLVNCTVKDLDHTGGDTLSVGLLAGVVGSSGACNVSNCQAYAESEDGKFNCSIDTDADNVGGLIGSVQGTANIEKCSASLTEITGNAQNVGGLAGRVQAGGTVKSCYADTGVWGETSWASGMSGRNVGGLLGIVEGSGSFTLENSYAVGWVAAAEANVNGLVGVVDGGSTHTAQNCYAAVQNNEGAVEELAPAGFTKGNCTSDYNAFTSFLTNPTGVYVKADANTTHAYGISGTTDQDGTASGPVYPFPRLSSMPHYGDWPQAGAPVIAMAYYEVYQNTKDNKYSIRFYNKDAYQELINDEDYTVVMDGYAAMLSTSDAAATPRTVTYNDKNIEEANNADLKLMDAGEKFGSELAGKIGFIDKKTISIGDATYHPLFLSNAMMAEGENTLAQKDSYYQKLEVVVDEVSKINAYFNPYVAKSEFLPGSKEPETPEFSILRTSRQVTAYSYKAMQSEAIGNSSENLSHRLLLERNISLTQDIKTDSTISDGLKCKDLSIPDGTLNDKNESAPGAYVIVELNGKTLTGTGTGSVITAGKGKLEVYGQTRASGSGTKGTITAKITGDKTAMIFVEAGAKGTLTNVTIDNSSNSGDSVNMGRDVTLIGCRIIE